MDLPTLGRPTMPALKLMLILEAEENLLLELVVVIPKTPIKFAFRVKRDDSIGFGSSVKAGIR